MNSPGHSVTRYALAVVWSVVAGVGVAIQSRVNGELGVRIEDGALAALISFSSGLVILAVGMIFSRAGRRGLRTVFTSVRQGQLPWWGVLGGLGGAFLVLSQGLVAGILGVALFSVAVVAGQTLGALWIDTAGLLGMAKLRLGWWRLIGALLVVVGVAAGFFARGDDVSIGWAFLLPLLAGMGVGFQQALNGSVRTLSGSWLSATFINFTVGTLVLAIATAIISPLTGGPTSLPTDWWLYTGGLVGTIFIAIQTVTVNHIGVLGLGVSLVTGQILGALVLDVFVPVGDHPVSLGTIAGALLTVVGSALVNLARRRAPD